MISVLYVDDEPDLLELCKIFLEQTGDFRVDTTQWPREVAGLLEKNPYDAIICDYQMPEMDGISVLKEVRHHAGDLPFILFTGRGREDIVIEALNQGADFYLQKGGDITAQFAELASKLRQAVIRRQAQQSLRQSQKMLADIINFLPDATFAIDRAGIVIAWNRAIEEMTGIAAVDMIGRGNYEYALPFYGTRRPILIDLIFEPVEKIKTEYSQIVREKDVLIAETNLPRPKGVQRILMGKASPLYNQMGEIAGSIESIRDITAQKQAEDALFSSRQMLQLVFDHIPQRVFWKDTRSVYVGCNKKLADDAGYADPADLIGKTDYDTASRETADKYRSDDKAVMESGQAMLNYEERQIKPDGSEAWLVTNKIPLRNKEGTVIGVLGTFEDITARKKAESELQAAYEQLAASDEELRGQFEELAMADMSIRSKEEQLKEITTTIPGVVYQFYARPGGAFGFYYLSERARDILELGNDTSDFFDRFTAQVHPDDRKAFLDSVDDAVKRNVRWTFEGRFFKPSGAMIWFQGISSPATHGNEVVFSGIIFDITDRKNAEDTLRQESEKYRTLVEHSQDAVFIIQDEKLVFANRALADLTGYEETAITGRPLGELVVPEDRDRVLAQNRDRMSGQPVPETSEFSLLHADGKTRSRINMNAGLAMYNGRPATIGTFHDVTCERQREDTLQKSEQKYRELAELLPQIVFEMDTGMRITYANHYALSSLGFTQKDLERGINALDHIDPSQHAMILENARKLAQGEMYESPEYTAIRNDGSRFSALIYSSPIFQDKTLTGFRGVIVDISAWKTASAARMEIEERYRTLAEAAQDLIYIIDKNDTVVYVNNYARQTMRKEMDEIIGKPRSALFSGSEGAKQYQSLQRVFTSGMPLRVQSTISIPGRETWQDTHLVPLKDPDGSTKAVLGISRDITELKWAQTSLKRSNEKLNLLNSITRHDVVNQLTILHGYIQLARMKEPDAMVGDFLKKIENASDTIQRQIEFTRTYQDLGMQAPDWFALDRIIEKARPVGIVFTSLCKGTEVFADPMLEKVFFNLFDNAIRHGERVTSMIVRCELHGDELIIIVEDDGVGIPLDEKQRIFGKGFGKNTGYGLFLVREILAITGISIHETGSHGSGARFEIAVPKTGFRQTIPK